jgi:hypothetical protein
LIVGRPRLDFHQVMAWRIDSVGRAWNFMLAVKGFHASRWSL